MSGTLTNISTTRIDQRARQLLAQQLNTLHIKTDRLFCALLLVEWITGILVSFWYSPLTWAGINSDIHMHVYSAIILGALICIPPIIVALKFPGKPITRHTIAVGQLLYSALLIHLSGGRIESHFHVFGSLAFLAFYRDWRVLVPASAVVAIDHILRGIFFPQSVYGVEQMEPWRWLEHIFWVLFEDAFLVRMCLTSVQDHFQECRAQAEIEAINTQIESLVERRTAELEKARAWSDMQYQVMKAIDESESWHETAGMILRIIGSAVPSGNSRRQGTFWRFENGKLYCLSRTSLFSGEQSSQDKCEDHAEIRLFDEGLPGKAWSMKRAVNLKELGVPPTKLEYANGIAFPVSHGEEFIGVLEFLSEQEVDWDISSLETFGRQLGQFVMRRDAESGRKRLANIVNQSSDSIIIISADGRIKNWNNGAEKSFLYNSESVLGKDFSILLPEGSGNRFLDLLHTTLREGRRLEGQEETFCTSQQKNLEMLVFAIPWFNESGQYEGAALTLHNITQRKEAERRLSEFYSIVSHELRSPLTSIRGALGLIENNTVALDSPEATELVEVARTSSDRLIRLVNDILDLKKLESGKLQLKRLKINTADLLSGALAGLSGISKDSGIELVVESAVSDFVYADPDKSIQIITNLVSNAIKFSKRGQSVVLAAKRAGNNMIRISVTDHGPGIQESDLSSLFDKFKQLDSSDSRPCEGTGLGLAIAKALTEEHGGTIGVSSRLGRGSQFWFELPAFLGDENTIERGKFPIAFAGEASSCGKKDALAV